LTPFDRTFDDAAAGERSEHVAALQPADRADGIEAAVFAARRLMRALLELAIEPRHLVGVLLDVDRVLREQRVEDLEILGVPARRTVDAVEHRLLALQRLREPVEGTHPHRGALHDIGAHALPEAVQRLAEQHRGALGRGRLLLGRRERAPNSLTVGIAEPGSTLILRRSPRSSLASALCAGRLVVLPLRRLALRPLAVSDASACATSSALSWSSPCALHHASIAVHGIGPSVSPHTGRSPSSSRHAATQSCIIGSTSGRSRSSVALCARSGAARRSSRRAPPRVPRASPSAA
jgi:hypothetical protein